MSRLIKEEDFINGLMRCRGIGRHTFSLILKVLKNTPESYNTAKNDNTKNATDQERCLTSPVMNEQKVYRVNVGAKVPIIKMTVTEVRFTTALKGEPPIVNFTAIDDKDNGQYLYFASDIGESVFLTIDDAEQKMRRMKL